MPLPQDSLPEAHERPPAIRRIGTDRPFRWLSLGWQDLRQNPVPSLAYGLLFAICGDILLLLALPHPDLFMTAVSGFFLVAPLLAAGLYEISRHLADGERITFVDSLAAWRVAGPTLGLFGVTLAIIALVWERLTALLVERFLTREALDVPRFFEVVIDSGTRSPWVALWFAGGALLALLVFAATAVSIPMILDRNTDLVVAARVSLRAVVGNLDAMFVWAVLIVGLTILGFASFLFGLIVLMPVIGHATWHAYCDVVGSSGA